MRLVPGAVVLVYLREPRERLVAKLLHRDISGIVVRGLGLDAFEDWLAQLGRGGRAEVGPSEVFIPMLRVERLLLDEAQAGLVSLGERFEQRTGRPLAEALDEGGS